MSPSSDNRNFHHPPRSPSSDLPPPLAATSTSTISEISLNLPLNHREPIVRALKNEFSPAALGAYLGCQGLALKQMGRSWIAAQLKSEELLSGFIEKLSSAAPREQVLILDALSTLRIPNSNRLYPEVARLLKSADEAVVNAAIKVIALRFPAQAEVLVPILAASRSQSAIRIACLSGQEKLIDPLIRILGKGPEEMPPYFGLLLNPQWLARKFERDSALAAGLAQKFGYTREPLTGELAGLLRAGLMFASTPMLDVGAQEIWGAVTMLQMPLLSMTVGGRRIGPLPDFAPQLWSDAFVAAIREADRANLESRREGNQYSYRNLTDFRDACCFHAPYAYIQSQFLSPPDTIAAELGMQDDDRRELMIDHASFQLETNEEIRTEAELLFNAKWRAIANSPSQPRIPATLPVDSEEGFPLLKYAVLDQRRMTNYEPSLELSKCARSVSRLSRYLGHREVEDVLLHAESRYAGLLPPIGLELQAPTVKNDLPLSLGWKQALRFFDIPSPRRPEYLAIIEAAFRPAATFHAPIVGAQCLAQLGIFPRAMDLGMHLSIQGDLGPDVRYLLFAQQFISQSLAKNVNPSHRRLARLMSKGYAHLNQDAEYAIDRPGEVAAGPAVGLVRTELRACLGNVRPAEQGNQLVMARECLEDVIATQLLAAAMISDRIELRVVWDKYSSVIEGYADTLPPPFRALLETDWYQCTGDPTSGELVSVLPTMRLKEDVRAALAELGATRSLREELSRIRNRAAVEVHTELSRFAPDLPKVSALGELLDPITAHIRSERP